MITGSKCASCIGEHNDIHKWADLNGQCGINIVYTSRQLPDPPIREPAKENHEHRCQFTDLYEDAEDIADASLKTASDLKGELVY